MRRNFFKNAGNKKIGVVLKIDRFSNDIFGCPKKFFCQLIGDHNRFFVGQYLIFISLKQFERKDIKIIFPCILSPGFYIFIAYRKREFLEPFRRSQRCGIFVLGAFDSLILRSPGPMTHRKLLCSPIRFPVFH